tara:strand:+ start:7672 stop:7953 length:282 start_codon:yes stop_codon:yes gene_type:complete
MALYAVSYAAVVVCSEIVFTVLVVIVTYAPIYRYGSVEDPPQPKVTEKLELLKELLKLFVVMPTPPSVIELILPLPRILWVPTWFHADQTLAG